jgi:restriction endonuclease S subunit
MRYDTSYGKNYGKYRFHTGATDSKYYCDNININKYTIILNKTNGSGKCNIFLDKNISCAKQTYICQSITNELETQYIYYYLYDKKKQLEFGYMGACHKNLSFDFLNKFIIKIPKNKQLIADLEPTFQEIERLQNEVRTAEELYKQYIKELAQEAIPPQFNEMIYNVENNNENDLEDEKSQDNTEQNISILNEMHTPNNNEVNNNEVNNNKVNNNEVNCDWIMKSGKNKGQRCNKNNCKTHNKTNEEVKTNHEVVLSEEEVKTSDDDTNTPTNTRTNTPDDNRCQGITKKGERCSKKVKSGESKCNSHK